MTTLFHEPSIRTSGRFRILRGLLWREWILYYHTLSWLLTAWLIAAWVLVLLNWRPELFVLFVGSAFALRVASRMGGGDVADGSEEFAFALPMHRSSHYLLRMSFGLIVLLAFCVSTHLIAAYDLPQRAWSLIVETGLTERGPSIDEELRFFTPLSVLLPLAYFGVTFANAATSHSARSVYGTDSTSLFVVTALVGVGLYVEGLIWPRYGYITNPLLAALCVGPLVLGYRSFRKKEVSDSRL